MLLDASTGVISAEPITVQGTTSGTGAIDAINNGTATLSGPLSVAGDTDIGAESGATLVFQGAVAAATLRTITFVNGGRVNLTNGDDVFAATNNLVASATQLEVTSATALGSASLQTANGGTVMLEGPITVTNPITISGYGDSGAGAIQSNGDNVYSGTITLSADAGIGVWGNTLSISSIANSSYTLRDSGSSPLIITGTPAFAGPIDVYGTLQVNGTLPATSSITVESGSTVDGRGTAGLVTVLGGGNFFLPVHSPGTFTTAGVTLNASAQLLRGDQRCHGGHL